MTQHAGRTFVRVSVQAYTTQAEVDALMDLLVNTLMSELESLNENGVRLNTIGDTDSLPAACRATTW